MRTTIRILLLLVVAAIRTQRRLGSGGPRRHRQGRLGRRAARRHRRSREPGADRKDAHGDHRCHRPVPHREPAAGHLHGDVHARRVLHREARGRRRCRAPASSRSTRDMKVGGVSETITVTGETPVVDVQSTKTRGHARQRDDAEPAGRSQLQLPAHGGAGHAVEHHRRQHRSRCSRSSRCTAAAASSRA